MILPTELFWRCNNCKEIKHYTEFHCDNHKRFGIMYECRVCKNSFNARKHRAIKKSRLKKQIQQQAPINAIITMVKEDPLFLLQVASIRPQAFRYILREEQRKLVERSLYFAELHTEINRNRSYEHKKPDWIQVLELALEHGNAELHRVHKNEINCQAEQSA